MKRPVLLIIDDECDIKALYKSIVNRHFEFEIVEANSVKTVQEVLKNHTPDYVLLDLCLQDGDGFDLIPALKKINSSVKILVITAFSHCMEKRKATELGAVGLLAKPFEKDAFIQHLNMMHNLG
ncbi:response regulator [Brumimicrobium mesophilum]|uniref:response regulator n=1 Tax=Brumimicrobium mesophilum TaxID=392717 RepID=UPI000D144A22|nr:response regulator [Brumimicrobium mesophilum]